MKITKIDIKQYLAIKSFQKTQHLKVNGKITPKLLEQLKVAIESKSPADPSQPDLSTKQ